MSTPKSKRVSKGIYFPVEGKPLAVTFDLARERERRIHEAVRGVPAARLREALGQSFKILRAAAESEGRTFKEEVLVRLEAAIDRGEPGFRESQPENESGYRGWPVGSKDEIQKVTELLDRSPRLVRVLDPFAGTGSYPIAAGQLGRTAFYCEVSPVQRIVAEARITALGWTDRKREAAANEIETVAETPLRLPRLRRLTSFPDEALHLAPVVLAMQASIAQAKSRGLDLIIRAAALRALPSDRHLEATDLDRLSDRWQGELAAAAEYLRHEDRLQVSPQLVAADATDLKHLPSLGLDAVITNPPSLNLVDYESSLARWLAGVHSPTRTRGTSSELFPNAFARVLPSGSASEAVQKFTRERLAKLTGVHPRRRLMNYALSMADAFGAIVPHLKRQASVVLDVPQSTVGGRIVDTPHFLSLLLTCHGFREIERHDLIVRGFEKKALKETTLVMRR